MPGSTRSYEFAKRLVSNGNEVYMVTSNWQKKSEKTFTVENGIKVFWGKSSYTNKMGYFSRLISFISFATFALIKGIRLDYDLIIASSTPITVGMPAIILKKIKKVKLVFEVRDVWPQLPIALGVIKSKIVIKLLRLFESKIYFESDSIIALSEGMKHEIMKVNNTKKISVITNLCDNKKFNIKRNIGLEFKRNYLNLNKNPLIIYAGAFGIINNVIYLVDIAKESKKNNLNINFLLVGDGHQRKKIELKAKNLKLLNKNLFILDYLPKDMMPKLLSASTIVSSLFVDLPEMENNSANKFFDGLAAGKPMMLNYGGWQSKLIRKHNAGFVIPNGNPKKALKIIKKYIYNNDKIKSMSIQSRMLSSYFSIDKNFSLFKKTIDSLQK